MYHHRIENPSRSLIIITDKHSFIIYNSEATKVINELGLKGNFFNHLKDSTPLVKAIIGLETHGQCFDQIAKTHIITSLIDQPNVLITNRWDHLTTNRTLYCKAVLEMTSKHYDIVHAENLARLDIERLSAAKLKEELRASFDDGRSAILDMLFDETVTA